MTNLYVAQTLVAEHARELQAAADSNRRWLLRRAARQTQQARAPLAVAPIRTVVAAPERRAAA